MSNIRVPFIRVQKKIGTRMNGTRILDAQFILLMLLNLKHLVAKTMVTIPIKMPRKVGVNWDKL